MRTCVFILAGLVSTAIAQAAGNPDTAYANLRNEAHAAKLLNGVAEDIKARRLDDALKKANEVAALEPDNAAALNAKGAVLTELKRFDEASKILDAAVAADPKSLPAQFNRGEILFLQKKYSDAALLFYDLQSSFGPMPILKFKTYLCYALDGRKDKARAALAGMRYPQDDVAWYFAYAVDRLLDGKRGEAKRLIAAADTINANETSPYRDALRDTGLLK